MSGKQKEGARVKMGASPSAQTPIAYICSNVGRRIGFHEKTRYSIGPDMEFGDDLDLVLVLGLILSSTHKVTLQKSSLSFLNKKWGARTDSPIYHVRVECYYIYIEIVVVFFLAGAIGIVNCCYC